MLLDTIHKDTQIIVGDVLIKPQSSAFPHDPFIGTNETAFESLPPRANVFALIASLLHC
jgi:hypothetical protein